MASYVLDEFLGAGLLKDVGRKFAADGWDDVPTLKVIGAEGMEALDLTSTQRDALELRIYLHNRSLMKYADRMEASKIRLINLMSMKPSELASKFKMRKAHAATFVDTALACGIQMPPDLPRMSSVRRRSSTAFWLSENAKAVLYFELAKQRPLYKPPPFELHKSTLSDASSFGSPPRSPPRKSSAGEWGFKRFLAKHSPPRKSNAVEPLRMSNAVEPPRKSNAVEPPRKSNAVEPPRMSNAVEPPRMSNAVEPPRKSNAVEPPRKSNAVEPPRMSNAVEPPRKSNAVEPPRKSNAVEPPRKSNAVEPPRMSNAVEPPRKSNAVEPPRKSNAVEPPRKSNAVEPPRKSNAVEPPRMSNAVEPPRKSNAVEPPRKSNAVEPPRKSNAVEPPRKSNAVEPPRKSNAVEPPRMSNAGEPLRKSNAGEWGPRNFHAKNSPPRKSSAGELGFRNLFAKNSPPRKSDAGFYEYACARSSPPRMSNIGEMGSNGNSVTRNSPPRKSNVGELGSNGNPVARYSPPRKSNAVEPPRMSNAGEPFRKSNAGEWGPRNFHAKNSPPRKSSAGELGFRNLFAKNSPPRKSDAGFYEYACARSSPPRMSNVGELGFNGNSVARNSPPRKSNVGELGFNGNPFAARYSPPRKSNAGGLGLNGNSVARNSPPRKSNAGQLGFDQPSWVRPADATKPNAPKGVFSATSTKRQLCGMVKAPSSDKVAKIALLENVLVRQLAPEHSYGVDSRTLKGSRKLQPFKASNLWSDKATLFFCIRRPGCVMCRAEAHQLFARKPIFDALGIQLVAVLLEDIHEEVWAFWPRYWAGMVVLDEKRDFFRALGGGKLMKDSLFTGFFLNPIARLNWKRAMKTGIHYNTRGEGQIKGGMFIVRPGKGGVAYQFAEKNFGDWAPLDEVLQVCHIIGEEGDCDGY